MNDYIPSYDVARNNYATGRDVWTEGDTPSLEAFDEFDRFIAQVKADALREAAKWVDDLAVHDGLMYKEFDDGEIEEKCIPDALRDRADKIERGEA